VSNKSRDYWSKIVDFLQQNWALIDETTAGATIWFFSDTSGVFEKLEYQSAHDAAVALLRNGFRRFSDDAAASTMMTPPTPSFTSSHTPTARSTVAADFGNRER
jgi:hypothetical protein